MTFCWNWEGVVSLSLDFLMTLDLYYKIKNLQWCFINSQHLLNCFANKVTLHIKLKQRFEDYNKPKQRIKNYQMRSNPILTYKYSNNKIFSTLGVSFNHWARRQAVYLRRFLPLDCNSLFQFSLMVNFIFFYLDDLTAGCAIQLLRF